MKNWHFVQLINLYYLHLYLMKNHEINVHHIRFILNAYYAKLLDDYPSNGLIVVYLFYEPNEVLPLQIRCCAFCNVLLKIIQRIFTDRWFAIFNERLGWWTYVLEDQISCWFFIDNCQLHPPNLSIPKRPFYTVFPLHIITVIVTPGYVKWADQGQSF